MSKSAGASKNTSSTDDLGAKAVAKDVETGSATNEKAKKAELASDNKKKAKKARKATLARINGKWPNGPRTSIEHYEAVEIEEGRLNPAFQVFWRDRYRSGGKK